MTITKIEIDGHPFDVELGSSDDSGSRKVLVNGVETHFDINDDMTSLIVDNKSYHLEKFRDVDGIPCRLTIDGVDFMVNFPSTERKRNSSKKVKKSGTMKAPIAGTIHKINFEEGNTVEEGQPSVVLEAMKMQNSLEAPISGVIRVIYVKEGQTVSGGEKLLEIIPEVK